MYADLPVRCLVRYAVQHREATVGSLGEAAVGATRDRRKVAPAREPVVRLEVAAGHDAEVERDARARAQVGPREVQAAPPVEAHEGAGRCCDA